MVPSQWYVLLAVDLMSAPFANITLLVGMLALVLHILTCNCRRCPVVCIMAKHRVRKAGLYCDNITSSEHMGIRMGCCTYCSEQCAKAFRILTVEILGPVQGSMDDKTVDRVL